MSRRRIPRNIPKEISRAEAPTEAPKSEALTKSSSKEAAPVAASSLATSKAPASESLTGEVFKGTYAPQVSLSPEAAGGGGKDPGGYPVSPYLLEQEAHAHLDDDIKGSGAGTSVSTGSGAQGTFSSGLGNPISPSASNIPRSLNSLSGLYNGLDSTYGGADGRWQSISSQINALPDPYRAQLSGQLSTILAATPITMYRSIVSQLRGNVNDSIFLHGSIIQPLESGALGGRVRPWDPSSLLAVLNAKLADVLTHSPSSGGSGGSGGSAGTGRSTGGATSEVSQTPVKSATKAPVQAISLSDVALTSVSLSEAQSLAPTKTPTKTPAPSEGLSGGASSSAAPPPNFDSAALEAALTVLRAEVAAIKGLVDEIKADLDRAINALLNFINTVTGLNLERGELGGNGLPVSGANATLASLQGDINALVDVARDILAKAQAARDAMDDIEAKRLAVQAIIDDIRTTMDDPQLGPLAKIQALQALVQDLQAAMDALQLSIQTARDAVTAFIDAVTSGIQQIVALLTSIAQTLRQALEDLHAWLHQKVNDFQAALDQLEAQLRALVTYSHKYLSFGLRWVKCIEKQDPWTQSGGDKIHMAYITVDPGGNIASGFMDLGRYHPQGSNGFPAEKSDWWFVRRFPIDTWTTFNNTFLVFTGMFEVDNGVDYQSRWNSVVNIVGTDVRAALQNVTEPTKRGETMDLIKDQIRSRIQDNLLNLSGDDFLGVNVSYVRHLYPAQGFTPTPRATMETPLKPFMPHVVNMSDAQLLQLYIDGHGDVSSDTDLYRNKAFSNHNIPRPSGVSTGQYQVHVKWAFEN